MFLFHVRTECEEIMGSAEQDKKDGVGIRKIKRVRSLKDREEKNIGEESESESESERNVGERGSQDSKIK